MRKHLFILPLLTTALLTAYAQTPLNRLDSLYFDGDVEAASVYAEKVLNDPNQSASQKKAVSAYLEMRRFLTDTTLSGREKRTGLDACLLIAEEAATSDPVCADAWYARALNRMFAANMVREFSSLEAITAAKDDFIRAINADPNHFGSLAELSGIYGHMPELITFGDRSTAVSLSKQLYAIRGTKRDAQQLVSLLLRRDWSLRKREKELPSQESAFAAAKSPFEAAAAFEGSFEAKTLFGAATDDRTEAARISEKFHLTPSEIDGENAWSRDF